MAQLDADAARVRFFPPGVPLLAILLGVALQRWRPLDLRPFIPEPLIPWLGVAVIVAAMFGLGAPAVLLVRRSGQSENPWKPTTAIVDRGPFRFTRNPMYLQLVIMCCGFGLALANGWILLLTPVCAWVLLRVAILPEEAYLEGRQAELGLPAAKPRQGNRRGSDHPRPERARAPSPRSCGEVLAAEASQFA